MSARPGRRPTPRRGGPAAPEPTAQALGILLVVLLAVAGLAVAVAAAPMTADVVDEVVRGPQPLRTTIGAEDADGWRTASLRGTAADAVEPLRFRSTSGGLIEIEQSWVDAHIVTAEVPLLAGPVRCHRLLVPPLRGALGELEAAGLGELVDPEQYGGCHVPRHILFNPARNLSLHAWGLAVDLNVEGNEYGVEPAMDQRVVEVFTRWGFAWGGNWRTPDGMHFELVEIVGPDDAAPTGG